MASTALITPTAIIRSLLNPCDFELLEEEEVAPLAELVVLEVVLDGLEVVLDGLDVNVVTLRSLSRVSNIRPSTIAY
jgi:hypothetical protein